MQAVLLTRYGGPEALEYREDVAIPMLGPDEVLIRVGAAGINNTDIWTREGAYTRSDAPAGWLGNFAFPRIQGGDIVGEVVDVGNGVDPHRVGERVLVDPTLHAADGMGITGVIGSERDGGFAQYAAVPSTNAHAIRSPMRDAELATFPIAYVTAEGMLNAAGVASGDTILVTGASGGAGSALVQLAQLRHARVIALTSAAHLAQVQGLGPTAVMLRDHPDFEAQLASALAGEALDVVADVVGGPSLGLLLGALRPGGRCVTAGAIAGPVVQLDLRTVYLNRLRIIGSTMGTRQEFSDLVRYIEEGRLKPLLSRSFPLSEIGQAQQAFGARDFFGKLVLIP